MEANGNERALSATSVTELTGEDRHECVTELEVIFGPYETIDEHALRRCSNLQKVALINCRLQRLPTLALRVVRESLVHLCLSAQRISAMEPLDLPNLRALYLQQNQIERIEGLEACRHLKVLWLYGNRIKRIENLGTCTDLRELWLQDNAIQTLCATDTDPSLENLPNLKTLCLAKNRVRNIDEIQALRKLVNLQSLSFADEHFGSNPIVRHPEYREVAISTARQLLTLDGVMIDEKERSRAVDLFLSQALEFNDVVAELTLKYEQDLQAIQTKKERVETNASMLQRELVEALNEVEQLASKGTKELEEEKHRQFVLREQHTQMTVDALESLKVRFQSQLDEALEAELEILDDEEALYEVLEQEAVAEHNLASTVSTLQCTLPDKIAFENLAEHAPDYRYIANLLEQQSAAGAQGNGFRILQIYRFFHSDLVQSFNRSLDVVFKADNSRRQSCEGSVQFLYCAVCDDEAMTVLQHGFQRSEDGATPKWLVLFSNPLQALAFSEGTPGAFFQGDIERNNQGLTTPANTTMRSHNLLQCQVFVNNVSEAVIGDAMMQQTKSLQSIVSMATAAVPSNGSPNGTRLIHTKIENGEMYFLSRDEELSHVLPQFVILCSQRLVFVKVKEHTAPTQIPAPETILASYSDAVERELKGYHACLWRELDPAEWATKVKHDRELEELDRQAANIKEQIAEERKTQKKMLKSGRQRE